MQASFRTLLADNGYQVKGLRGFTSGGTASETIFGENTGEYLSAEGGDDGVFGLGGNDSLDERPDDTHAFRRRGRRAPCSSWLNTFVLALLIMLVLAAIPRESLAQYSYEVYIMNRQSYAFEIEQVCVNSLTCFAGTLRPKQSIWLTKQSHAPEKRLIVTFSTKGGSRGVESCEISQPKSYCAYEILVKVDGSIVKSIDREDCIALHK
jgi:hypothetical protein